MFYWPLPAEGAKYAYAWYVTDPRYFCSALVAMKRMRLLREKDPVQDFTYQVDFVLVHSNEDVKSEEVKVNRWLRDI